MYSGDFGAGEFQYAIRIFNGAKGVAISTKFEPKISQNCTDFSSVQEIEDFFPMKSQVFESATSNMLSPKGVAMATKFRKIGQNCTYFRFLQKVEEFFACSVGFYGLRELKCTA